MVKQGMTTSVDKEIFGIAKSCETTFQDLIKVGLDGDQGGRTWQALAMKPFVKRVFTIFATNESFLRVISNFRI